MPKQTINTGTIANDNTGDTLRTAGIKINANFTELYNTLGGVTASTTQLHDSGLDIVGTTARTKIGAVNPSSEISIDFPDSAGIVTVNTATQTLTNKTLDSAALKNPTVLDLKIFDDDSSHYYQFIPGSLTSNYNLNIPTLSDSDTLVFNKATATLEQKTLNSTNIIHKSKVHEYLADSLGNSVISFTNRFTNLRNNIKIESQDSGTAPNIDAIGGGTGINLNINAKGRGSVRLSKVALYSQNAANGTVVSPNASFIGLTGASTGSVTLADGTTNGELKTIIRKGGTGKVTLTPTTFAQGVGIEFDSSDTAQLIWDTTTGWNIIGGYGYQVV